MIFIRRHKTLLRIVAAFCSINIFGITCFESIVYGLTSGPGSPDFSSFEPVATTDMVNTFTGDFTYNLPVVNIPGPGGGYSLSLSYHSGNSSEQEASWVGFGWTLNPGAINRNVRGVPDEYNGNKIDYYNKAIPNWTISGGPFVSLEAMSQSGNSKSNKDRGSLMNHSPHGLNFGYNIRYNNYQGFNASAFIGASFKGYGSLGMQAAPSGITFSGALDVQGMLTQGIKSTSRKIGDKRSITDPNKSELTKKLPRLETSRVKKGLKSIIKFSKSIKPTFGVINISAGSEYGLLSFSESSLSFPISPSTGFGFNYNISNLISISPNTGVELGGKGGFFMQYNKPFISRSSYGFLNNQANPSKNVVCDYYVEKENSWDKRDLFLGIPFSTPDFFNLSGEGLSGSFRLHNTNPGHFFPAFNSSKKFIYNLGSEFQFGTSIGVGLNVGIGFQETRIKKWGQYDGNSEVPFPVNGGSVMRFSGDLGGSVVYGNDELIKAKVTKEPKMPGIAGGHLDFSEIKLNGANEIKTSSPIKFNDDLSQFSIINKDGVSYSYGEKISNSGGLVTGATAFNRNEANLGINVDGSSDGYLSYGLLALKKEEGQYKVDHCQQKVINGTIKSKPFATTYLLGEIRSPYYVDIDNNGPTDNDFGGWTKFEYFKKYGNNNDEENSNWYRWRIPYYGLFYSQNRVSDKRDDIGSVSTGEKEVYYLEKIETKTHVAYFVTNKSFPERFDSHIASNPYLKGSQKNRSDGIGAAKLKDGIDPSSISNARGVDELENLEKIVLFAKNRPGKPIQTTYFGYSYSLSRGLPNGFGKLTLEKVWIENEGMVNAKISPYQFKYSYKPKATYPKVLLHNYDEELGDFFNLSNGSSGKYSSTAENPDYDLHLLGPWGFTQPKGKEQHKNQRPWIYQGTLSNLDDYDPAAWQLKRIILPSGGEILVEYEAKDYSYVQNRRPMAMASIRDFDDEIFSGTIYKKHPFYIVDLSDFGLDMHDSDSELNGLVLEAHYKDYFIKNKNRIYFKFLYDLVGADPSLNNCSSEYISGYAKVEDVEFVPELGGLKITLDGTGSAYDNNKAGYSMVPRQGCYDFYSTQRVGMVDVSDGCQPSIGKQNDDKMLNYLSIREKCGGNTNIFKWPLFAIEFGGFAKNIKSFVSKIIEKPPILPIKRFVCKEFNQQLSYFRIPMLKAKRGGGIRVKKLLLLDYGLESGDAMIYGKKYHYINEEGESSGVATNEPSAMREENPLVGFLPKKHQSWFSRLTVGKDKEQSEGPIGESILPSPSVGHSRVIEENIHTGQTTSGFTVYSYNTVKDFAFDGLYTSTGKSGKYDSSFKYGKKGVRYSDLLSNTKKDLMNLELCKGGFVFGYKSKKIWAAQGFRFIQNDMHGKPKSIKTYGGELPKNFRIDEGNTFLAQGQQYEYYEPGEKVPLMSSAGEVDWELPGKEMDVTMDMRSVKDWGLDLSVAIDFSMTLPLAPPNIIVSFAGANIGYNEKILSTHSTSKVVKYPSMVKSVTSYRDGIASIVENIGFDKGTGETVLTSSRDIFDGIKNEGFGKKLNGKNFHFKLPAYWYYADLKLVNRLSESSASILSFGDKGKIREEGTWHFPKSIVSANVQTYGVGDTNHGTNIAVYDWFPESVTRDYGEVGAARNIIRPSAQYTYYDNPINNLSDNQSGKKVFEEGLIEEFQPFNFLAPSENPKWLKLNEITKYSPNGEPLEDVDIEGVFSAAKYAYNGTRVSVTASNAQYEDIYFDAFENIVSKKSHSGKGALPLDIYTDKNQSILKGIQITNNLLEKGAIFKCWFYDPHHNIDFRINFKNNSSSHWSKPMDVAKVGEWILKELRLSPKDLQDIVNNGNRNISIVGEVTGVRGFVYVDDARLQTADATSNCYVYDQKTLRLITQFDDAHFGTYYQYNNNGKLVRKLLETERGMKTVEEVQYNLPMVNR